MRTGMQLQKRLRESTASELCVVVSGKLTPRQLLMLSHLYSPSFLNHSAFSHPVTFIQHNLIFDNCHSHVAMALNLMSYGGHSRWTMGHVGFLTFIYGRFVRCVCAAQGKVCSRQKHNQHGPSVEEIFSKGVKRKSMTPLTMDAWDTLLSIQLCWFSANLASFPRDRILYPFYGAHLQVVRQRL